MALTDLNLDLDELRLHRSDSVQTAIRVAPSLHHSHLTTLFFLFVNFTVALALGMVYIFVPYSSASSPLSIDYIHYAIANCWCSLISVLSFGILSISAVPGFNMLWTVLLLIIAAACSVGFSALMYFIGQSTSTLQSLVLFWIGFFTVIFACLVWAFYLPRDVAKQPTVWQHLRLLVGLGRSPSFQVGLVPMADSPEVEERLHTRTSVSSTTSSSNRVLFQPLLPPAQHWYDPSNADQRAEETEELRNAFEEHKHAEYYAVFPNTVMTEPELLRYKEIGDFAIKPKVNKRYQLLMACCFILLNFLMLEICTLYSEFVFGSSSCSGSDTDTSETLKQDISVLAWFGLFLIITHLLRGISKLVGMELDENKQGSACFYFIGEYIATMYYCIYYRFLFARIEDDSIFAALTVIHLIGEWLSYPLRGTTRWFNFLKNLKCGRRVQLILQPGPFIPDCEEQQKDVIAFISLDFGLRTVVMTAVSCGVLVVFTFLRYGYNQDHFCSVTSSDSGFQRASAYISISVVLELLNLVIIHRIFWNAPEFNLMHRLHVLFTNRRFYAFSVLKFAGIVLTILVSRVRLEQL